MSQVFGYLCSDDSLTAELMQQVGESLQAISAEERGGLGIGWLQDGRSLLRKQPRKKAARVDLLSLVADVPTRALVGHVRHGDEGRSGPKELQPFRFRNWVYAQRGAEVEKEEVYRALRESVPDHVRRNIQGTSMAELIFHIFYTKVESDLSRTPQHEWPELYATKMMETMGRVERVSREYGVEEPGNLLAVAATDRCLVASRIGEPMHYRLVEGMEVAVEKPLFAGHRPRRVNHERYRAVLVANRVEESAGWQELPDRHVMWVDEEWNISQAEF